MQRGKEGNCWGFGNWAWRLYFKKMAGVTRGRQVSLGLLLFPRVKHRKMFNYY